MELLPIKTPTLTEADNVVEALLAADVTLANGDIVAISAKAIATTEGAVMNTADLEISDEANEWVTQLNRAHPDPGFRQAVLNETKRLNGTVTPGCPYAMLTDITPTGMEGSLLVANAGLDRSNVPEGHAVGWPLDPVASVVKIKQELEAASGCQLGVLMTDSCCRPRRRGLTALGLVAAGFDPLKDQVHEKDLYDRELKMTYEAIADQLATAANFLMGNAAQSVPAVIIRGSEVPMTGFSGWVPGIDAEEDLFRGAL